MNSIFHRTSIRNYENRPVEKEKILKLSTVSPYSGCAANAPVVLVPVFSMFSLGYPAESKVQQDRYEECRIHFIE